MGSQNLELQKYAKNDHFLAERPHVFWKPPKFEKRFWLSNILFQETHGIEVQSVFSASHMRHKSRFTITQVGSANSSGTSVCLFPYLFRNFPRLILLIDKSYQQLSFEGFIYPFGHSPNFLPEL